MRLKVTVICGQYLPNPKLDNDIIDPYVVIQIFGLPSDMKLFETKKSKNNGMFLDRVIEKKSRLKALIQFGTKLLYLNSSAPN